MVTENQTQKNQTENIVQLEIEQLLAMDIAVSLATNVLRGVQETLENIMKGNQKND